MGRCIDCGCPLKPMEGAGSIADFECPKCSPESFGPPTVPAITQCPKCEGKKFIPSKGHDPKLLPGCWFVCSYCHGTGVVTEATAKTFCPGEQESESFEAVRNEIKGWEDE